MDSQGKNNKENSADVDRILDEKALNEVVGGAVEEDTTLKSTGTGQFKMICPQCGKKTPHTPAINGLFVCNICSKIHKEI